MGPACRGDFAAAFLSSPSSVPPLCLCRFVSWLGSRGVFDFAADDGFCLPSTAISPLAGCALLLPFCFLAWVTGIFDFAAGDGFCLPSTAISPLADCALLLPFCLLAWVTGVFDFAAGDSFCLPSTAISPLAGCALLLPFCSWLGSRGSSISLLATASACRRLRSGQRDRLSARRDANLELGAGVYEKVGTVVPTRN